MPGTNLGVFRHAETLRDQGQEAKGGTKGGKKAAELKEEAKLSRELVQIEKLMQERSEKRQKRDEGGGGGGGDET